MPTALESVSRLNEKFDKTTSLRSVSTQNYDRIAISSLKRSFDIAFALFGLLVTGPVLLIACLAIVLESAGGPLFVQRRIGRNGKIFNIYKLRSMRSASAAEAFKTAKDDARLTRIGLLLRITNIDELPQLINVLKGDMSLIGPRPLSVDETDYIKGNLQVSPTYAGFIPSSRPGLVGLEQVNRSRELTYYERFEFNHNYETNWSIFLDIQIFVRSVLMCKHVSIAGGAGLLALILGCIQLMHISGQINACF